jgi:hypothetical protein
MPSRARILPRFNSGGRPVSVPGTTYTFRNPQGEIDRQGAQALEGDYHDALRQEQHAAEEQYRQMHADLEMAKLRRELAHDEAKVQRRIKYETMMEKAIPELYAIDPADPNAVQKRAQFAQRWPQLFHKENDVPGITSEFEQHTRLSSEAERQRNEIAAKKEAAEQRAADKAEAARTAAEDRKQRDKEHADLMRELHPKKEGPSDAIRERYTKSSKNVDDLKANLDKTGAFIQEQKAKEEKGAVLDSVSEGHLNRMLRSRDALQAQYNRELGRKEALELVHPELSPDYVAKPKEGTGGEFMGLGESGAKSSATPGSPAAIDTAQSDVPAIRNTAPLARGTATPSGEMDLSGSTSAPAEVAPPGDTGEDTVPNLGAVPVAQATPMPPPVAATPVAAAPVHPMEGKRVKHKETGQGGTIVNGEFVPDETEALQDQPAA